MKFLILSPPRSGSSLLQELINSHPRIHCEGELLTADWGYLRSEWLAYFLSKYPFPYFEYRRLRAPREAHYGFKYMSFHLMVNPNKVTRCLKNWGWKVILLSRKDQLAQAVSNLLALRCGVYRRRLNDAEGNLGQVQLDVGAVAQELRYFEKSAKMLEDICETLDPFRIVYEQDLRESKDWAPSLARLFEYLDVPAHPVSTTLIKSSERSFREQIVDYDALLEYLARVGFEETVAIHQIYDYQ